MTTLNEMATAAYRNSAAHGFWDDAPEHADALLPYLGNKIALIHSEASEALEELRGPQGAMKTYYRGDGKPEGLAAELADIVIRVGDLAAFLEVDLDAIVAEKMAFNAGREHKHGKAF